MKVFLSAVVSRYSRTSMVTTPISNSFLSSFVLSCRYRIILVWFSFLMLIMVYYVYFSNLTRTHNKP